MQKHGEWMDNKNYEQHMRCLRKIQTHRSKIVKSAMPNRHGKRNLNLQKEFQDAKSTERSNSLRKNSV